MTLQCVYTHNMIKLYLQKKFGYHNTVGFIFFFSTASFTLNKLFWQID